MKKTLVLVLALAVFSALMPLAEAQIDMQVNPDNVTVAPGELARYVLTVKNTQDTADGFIISYSGPHIEWKMPGDLLLALQPGESKSTDIIFNTYGGDASYGFNVIATSRINPSVYKALPFYLNVEVPPPVAIEGLAWVKSGQDLEVTVGLESTGEYDTEVVVSIKDGTRIVRTVSVPLHIDGSKELTETLSLAGILAGTYTVEATVEGQRASDTLEVPSVHDVSQDVSRGGNMLIEEITVSITNNGNVVERDYRVTRTAQADMVTGFSIAPESCTDGAEGQVCSFIIPELQPGETKQLVYRLEFWPSYTKLAAAVIIIAILSLWYYSRFSRPKIRKSSRPKGLHEHNVVIEIRGPGSQGAKNVVIRDWVSPLAKVIQQEGEKLSPVLRKSEAGTELIWKLGDVLSKEERILSYKIRTLVKGSLKMPRAYMRYRNKKGDRVRVYSGPILIE